MFVLDAQCQGPGALNGVHDGADHFRGGALAPQVHRVQLEDKGHDQTICEPNISIHETRFVFHTESVAHRALRQSGGTAKQRRSY